jgi:hypothetical protein
LSNLKSSWKILLASLLVIVIVLQIYTLASCLIPGRDTVHTVVLSWAPVDIAAGSVVSGYAASWKPQSDVSIRAVQVWMGNPYGILWEGDVYVTLNNHGDFQSPDQVILHYQFDKHAESSVPHQEWFQIGEDNSGFKVKAGETVWVWFAFNNFSDMPTKAGDGQVIIYYLA